jgi:hypothetical protein
MSEYRDPMFVSQSVWNGCEDFALPNIDYFFDCFPDPRGPNALTRKLSQNCYRCKNENQ